MVVSDLLVVTRLDDAGVEVDACYVGLAETNIRGTPEDRSERIDDVGRIKKGGGYLIEEGREQVIVVPVYEQHINRATIEFPRTSEPAEATAYDDNLGSRRNTHSGRRRGGCSNSSLIIASAPP
jgi:hypothetical protein